MTQPCVQYHYLLSFMFDKINYFILKIFSTIVFFYHDHMQKGKVTIENHMPVHLEKETFKFTFYPLGC